ncbi:hypothetical protein EJ06DRAFT_546226 [Trichodelitschia bisporula]|uniref:Uncharacterized protein n=1 Tax=Trichodelitschia bisporula TaxID=703511 RepID=A0A6G1I849_9PEZI|nr:hypothetical protein EJ06DRAFT_546226 [Trichodelitschia bisporula]
MAAPSGTNAAESSPSNAGNSLTGQKSPPPASPGEILTRRLVLFSFWAVILFLGLPDWADGKYALDNLNEFSAYYLPLLLSTLDVYYSPNQIPSSSSTVSPLATYIATELQTIFNEEQASLAHFIASTPWHSSQTKSITSELAATLTRRKTRS